MRTRRSPLRRRARLARNSARFGRSAPDARSLRAKRARGSFQNPSGKPAPNPKSVKFSNPISVHFRGPLTADPPAPPRHNLTPPPRLRYDPNTPRVNTGTTPVPSAARPENLLPSPRDADPRPRTHPGPAGLLRDRSTTAPPRSTPRRAIPPRPSARQSGPRCAAPAREAARWSNRQRRPRSHRRGGRDSPTVS